MQLYGRRSSINVQKVLWCLAELNLLEGRDFQRIDAGLEFGVVDTPEYRALNPNGLVPALVDGEIVLWESNTVVRYLAAKHGNQELLPVDPAGRADVERWMDWQLATFWAILRVAFLGLTRTPEAQRNLDAIRAAYREATRLLSLVEPVLARQPYFAQGRFTLADIGLTLAVSRWYMLGSKFGDVLGETPADLPALKAWLDRTTARPGFRAAVPA